MEEDEAHELISRLLDSGLIECEMNSSVRLFGLSKKKPFGDLQGEFVSELFGMFPHLTQGAVTKQKGGPSAASISCWKTGKASLSASKTVKLVQSILWAAYEGARITNAGDLNRACSETVESFNAVYLLICKYLRPQTEDAQREHERKMFMHCISKYLEAMDNESLAHMLDEARRTYVYERTMKEDPRIAVPPN